MSGRLWLRIDPDICLVVLEDGDGELVTSETFRKVSSRRLFLDCLAEVMREVVTRAPRGFEGIHRKGFELRGPEPFPGFLNELQSLCGYRIQVQEEGGVR